MPVIANGRGWISLASVRLTRVRLFGCPVAANAVCAAALLLSEYIDSAGRKKKGNYFLRGFTTSRALCQVADLLGTQTFQHMPLQLHRERDTVDVEIPNLFSGRLNLDRCPSSGEQMQLEHLFENNHCGFLRARKNIWSVALEKTHWEIRSRSAELRNTVLLDEVGAEFRFAFDTSDARGCWHLPQRVQSGFPTADEPVASSRLSPS